MLHTLYGRSLAFDTTYFIEYFALDLIMQVKVIVFQSMSVPHTQIHTLFSNISQQLLYANRTASASVLPA
jgi:hypothetical protein